MPFFFIFIHSLAPNRSSEFFMGVLLSPGIVLDFWSVKECELCRFNCTLCGGLTCVVWESDVIRFSVQNAHRRRLNVLWFLQRSAENLLQATEGAVSRASQRTEGLSLTTHVVCTLLLETWWLLTFWRPLLPHGYSYKASCARPG